MRYELSDYEWSVIKPMLPNKPRGTNASISRGRPSLTERPSSSSNTMAVANSCLLVEP